MSEMHPAPLVKLSAGKQHSDSIARKSVSSSAGLFRYSNQILQFTLDADWTILGCNQEASDQFSLFAPELIGGRLRSMLIELNDGWSSLLPATLGSIAESLRNFLPWDSEENYGLGWDLQFLVHKDFYFLTLVPMLTPEVSPSLGEEPLSLEPSSLQKTLRQLLLRTQQQEMRFRYFVRHLPGAHFTQERTLKFTIMNDALEKLLGGEVIDSLRSGAEWRDWVHPSDFDEMEKNLELCRNGCVPVATRFRLLMPNEDRILYLMELRVPVRGMDGKLWGYEGIWLDLTRESIAERRLQQASWKESLSEISGSLSHDFNNVLGGICGLSDLVYETLPPESEDYDSIKIIRDKSREAVGLIQRIIALNREDWGQIELHDFVKLIEDQRELIRIILPKDVTLELTLPSAEVPVRLDAVALRRILLIFASNSRDAVSFKGRVEVTARVVDYESYDRSGLFSSHCPDCKQAVELIFKDDGRGIDPAIIHRIFGPYFSTKESAHDSGLGLYSATQFARENKFDYGVRSELGTGTEMILLVPVEDCDEDYSGEDDSDCEKREDPNLVEDFPVAVFGSANSFLRPILDMLEHNGFSVAFLKNETAISKWLDLNGSNRSVLISVMSESSSESRDLCSRLDFGRGNLLSLLVLRGLNPDHFSDYVGSVFDGCYATTSEPSLCFRSIINFLEAK